MLLTKSKIIRLNKARLFCETNYCGVNSEFLFRQELHYCLHISNGLRRDLFHCIYWWLSDLFQRISLSKNDTQWTMRWDCLRNKCLYFLLHLLPLLFRKMGMGYQSLQWHAWFIFIGPTFQHSLLKSEMVLKYFTNWRNQCSLCWCLFRFLVAWIM